MKVLLIDDHPLILSALKTIIEGLGEHVSVVGVASAREGRLVLQSQSDIDLVLLDLQLADANGFDVLVEFRATYPDLPVVVVSASDRTSDVIRAIDSGAMGFVPKRASTESLFDALQMVMSGGIYVPAMSLTPDRRAERPADAPAGDPPPFLRRVTDTASMAEYQTMPSLESLGLTPRQSEVLSLLLQGKPNKLIARELGVSVETVKDHVAAVLRALGVSSRTQAVLAVGQMAQPLPRLMAWRKAAR